MKWLMRRFREWLNEEGSYRTEQGVKIWITGYGQVSIDLEDEGTKRVLRSRLEELRRFEIVDERLVERKREVVR